MDRVFEANKTLARLMPVLNAKRWVHKEAKIAFKQNLEEHFQRLFDPLVELYGHHYDLYFHLDRLLRQLAAHYDAQYGQQRANMDPFWFHSEKNLGIAVYVDLFAGDLIKLRDRIPYLKSLGVNYLHLMPLYLAPEGDSDGGYAVSDYRQVNPKLGTNEDLKLLAEALHAEDMRLVLDFVFNHTSDEHSWAASAKAGDRRYQDYYYLVSDEREVAEYNSTVREIFPTVRRGSFTWVNEVDAWVWTTFNSFQWDLNYANPEVFVAIADEMLHLASLGCDVLRLDALAFIWKQRGTVCESLPQAHTLIKAFNACLRISAPHVLFKSEAIVHPDEVNKYIGLDECQLSYNPLMMALMWESLATRETKLLTASLKRSFQIPQHTRWVNYIRCHDDIGWTWDDQLAAQLGINSADHRLFLNRFYTGQFDGSFARGVPFQENPANGDCRVCGTLASLAGLEQAVDLDDNDALVLALRRIQLLNALNLSITGIPLLYQGDDLGVFNDNSYLEDPHKRSDARWVNRKMLNSDDFARGDKVSTVQGRVAASLRQMIRIRQANPVFGASQTEILETYNPHAFAFARIGEQRLLVLANFSEHRLEIPGSILQILASRQITDLLTGDALGTDKSIELSAYQVIWALSH
ncbi:MAG TPA: alpha-amylase family protein [Marinobacterium sp.]|nr:alpha-amylase family protein [Marinobacterium sp.]